MSQSKSSLGRGSRRWKILTAKMRSEIATGERINACWLCGLSIDLDLHHYDRMSFTVDHRLSLEDHPELAETWSNLEPAHRSCNSKKGKGMETFPPTGSQIW